jgi:pimeloyl-ACP methyl ester carboxylesterase
MGQAEQKQAAPYGALPRGSSTLYALGDDPRFSYCAYVPAEPRAGDLLVTVHGTERDAIGIRDTFVPFAEEHGLTILSPLFPAGIDRPDDVDNYKFIRFGQLRFDRLLLRMVVAVERRTGWRLGPLRLVGFSGGAQFVQRFLYLHPGLVASASIAAPGRITLLDDTRDWWAGTRDAKEVFGASLDLAALRSVPVQVVVGADDTDTGVRSRVEQARALQDNYRNHGISSRLDVVPHSRHDLAGLVPSITDFLDGQLRNTGRFAS